MTKVFGLNIAKIVRQSIKNAGGLFKGTLTKSVAGVRNPLDLGAGTNPTTVSYPFEGITEDAELLSQGSRGQGDSTLRRTERTLTILGDSLPAGMYPFEGDRVTIRGVTYVLKSAKRDGADAAYECVTLAGSA